ncbi:hypothetical protein EAF04_003677 [Stromatinia cepivora]|nr:hypothetical protein EAF04_003677 [Stromatinia cepivora]
MRSLSFTIVTFTLTCLTSSGLALPTLDAPLSTHAATTNITHHTHTHERLPSTIDTDISNENQVSISKQPEEPIQALLQVQSLPFHHNITLPVSICLNVYENSDLNIINNPVCPDGQKPYTLLFSTSHCRNINPLIIESYRNGPNGIWLHERDSKVPIERWSLMFKCAGSESEAFSSLQEPRGLHVLNNDRMRTMVFPIINHDEAGLAFNPPSLGVLGPQVNKLPATLCLWSSAREYANAIRLIRPLKCPAHQKSHMHLFTQRECRGKYVLSDGVGMNATLFNLAEDVEEWSILYTCSDYDYEVENRDPVIGAVQELILGDGKEETDALKLLRKSIAAPTAHQISADPHNATLALTRTFIPQIFHIPISTCLSSTSETHYLSSLLRIVTPPTCPPDLPRLATLLYAERGCNGSVEYMPAASSYPHYKSLFKWTVTPQRVKGWSLGFLCHREGPLTDKYWEMERQMELVVEGKGIWDAVVKVVQVESEPGAAKKGDEGVTQTVESESKPSEDGEKGQEVTAQKVLQPREASAP